MKGAVNVPLGILKFKADPTGLTYDPALLPEGTVVTYFAAGGWAAKMLKESGNTDVPHMGGLREWRARRQPVDGV